MWTSSGRRSEDYFVGHRDGNDGGGLNNSFCLVSGGLNNSFCLVSGSLNNSFCLVSGSLTASV